MTDPKNLNKCCPSNDGNVGNAIACIIKIIKLLEKGGSNIENNLDIEHLRALDAENTLQLHISLEYERATTKENELEEALNTEIERATTEEENINNLLNLEIENRTQDVDAEELRASTAEEALNTKINFEITTERNRANSVESSLQTLLNQEINARTTGLTSEEERATQAELDLHNKINSDITTEKNRAETAEGVLLDNIDAEETRATTAEGILLDNIDNEVSRATGVEDLLNSKLTKEITDREADVDAEEVRAKAAESTLQGNIDAEALARQNADKAITDLIPTEATTTNQLADKDFVNQNISTASATFRGTFNLVSDLNLTTEATRAAISTALSTAIATADNNDYAFVEIPTSDASSTEIFYVDKYKYNGTAWAFEYKVNNSGYTATQWAAINSGINSALVTKLSDLPNNTTLQNSLNTLNLKDIIRVENIATNQSNVTSTITGAANAGRNELVIYKNTSSNELTLTVSTDYTTSDGSQITLYIPANGYSEISYINVGGTIYVRGA